MLHTMFGVEIIRGMGFRITEGPTGHGEVRNRLNNSGDSEIKSVATQLGDLYTMRIHADYRLSRTDVESRKTAQTAVENAKKIVETLNSVCLGPNRPQIISAIKEWEQKIYGAKP